MVYFLAVTSGMRKKTMLNESPRVMTYMDWVLAGYRLFGDAQPVEWDSSGEPMYSDEDVFLDDEDL